MLTVLILVAAACIFAGGYLTGLSVAAAQLRAREEFIDLEWATLLEEQARWAGRAAYAKDRERRLMAGVLS